MPNQQLIDYINQSKAAGQTDEQIKSALLANNWQEADIKDAFNAIIGKPKKNSRKLSLIIIVVVLILLIAGTSAYWLLVINKQEGSEVQTPITNLNEFDISSWKEFNNEFVSYKYPTDWNIKGFLVYSPDQSKKIMFSSMPKDQINKEIGDIFEYSKSIEPGTVTNERGIKIADITAKVYDVKGDSTIGSYSRVVIETQNYSYDFKCTPNASDETISTILSTVKILKK